MIIHNKIQIKQENLRQNLHPPEQRPRCRGSTPPKCDDVLCLNPTPPNNLPESFYPPPCVTSWIIPPRTYYDIRSNPDS